MAETGREFENVREVLESAIGASIVEVTQDDWDELESPDGDPRNRYLRVYLHLSNGATITFAITKQIGFYYDGMGLKPRGVQQRDGE